MEENPYLKNHLKIGFADDAEAFCLTFLEQKEEVNQDIVFLDGSTKRYYDFAITAKLPRLADGDDNSLSNLYKMRCIQEWFLEQEKLSNYPSLAEGCHNYSLSLLSDNPLIVDEDGAEYVRYQIKLRISYEEEI